jgi:hypothetical protein
MLARGSRSSPATGGVVRSTVMTSKPLSKDKAPASPPWSNPCQSSGATRNSVASCPVMKPTSCSRSIGMIGFCTAPSRASAAMTTVVSSVVGSCQDTTVPAPIPRSANAAAVAHAASWSWRVVRLRPWSSARIGRSGLRRAASAINVQNVLPSDTLPILNQPADPRTVGEIRTVLSQQTHRCLSGPCGRRGWLIRWPPRRGCSG